jgi:hypothetical protein
MIIRNLDADGDFTFGRGRQNYLRGDDAIRLNIKTRVKCFLNDCFWNMAFGVDWWNLLGTRNPTAQANIILQVRAMVAASYGVVKINSVEALTDRITRRLTIQINLDDIYTRGVVIAVQP